MYVSFCLVFICCSFTTVEWSSVECSYGCFDVSYILHPVGPGLPMITKLLLYTFWTIKLKLCLIRQPLVTYLVLWCFKFVFCFKFVLSLPPVGVLPDVSWCVDQNWGWGNLIGQANLYLVRFVEMLLICWGMM